MEFEAAEQMISQYSGIDLFPRFNAVLNEGSCEETL